MLKDRLKYIAAAAFGAGAIFVATGTGTHLVALQSPGSTVRAADEVKTSPSPEASPSPEPTPTAAAPVTAPAVTTAPENEATETAEDAQDANEAAEPADAADVADVADANETTSEDTAPAVATGQPATTSSNSEDHGSGAQGSDGNGD
jgi:hypothetical protein